MPLRSTGFDYHPEQRYGEQPGRQARPHARLLLHQKYLIIQGNYAGDPHANLVFTGSSNWGALGAVNDEILVNVMARGSPRST